jgi:8-hydroxy-5-deazaflavin:NADPH oxidoreductase
VRVAIVGGTGPFGRGLAGRLAAAGDEVVIGSRDAERARETAAELGVEGATNEECVSGADLVVLATKADAAVDTARGLADAIGQTPLLCVASALAFGKDGVRPAPGSVAAEVAAVVAAPVVAGLHSLAAASLSDDTPPDEDALVCGDDAEAKAVALELASKVVAGRAFDAGPSDNARSLEGMTAVIVNLNRRYKGHAGIRITGLP